jgi:hypothetical protein
MVLFCLINFLSELLFVNKLFSLTQKEYDDSTLEDPINYAFFMGPSMLAVLVYVLFKRPEDCFHYFNRIPFVVYSKY